MKGKVWKNAERPVKLEREKSVLRNEEEKRRDDYSIIRHTTTASSPGAGDRGGVGSATQKSVRYAQRSMVVLLYLM